MMRPISKYAPGWWDYSTLDRGILEDAARLSANDLVALSRSGFRVPIHETVEDFYLAEALEYVKAWQQADESQPAGVCGPNGPVEQMPLVARIVNGLEIDLRFAHFWCMDERVGADGHEADYDHSLEKIIMDAMVNRIRPELRMPKENLHFPKADPAEFVASWEKARCIVMQGGQGESKHWALNDPPKRQGDYIDNPPPAEVYRRLGTRIVEPHPLTYVQSAHARGGVTYTIPDRVITVGPVETWKAEKVSIWHNGAHDKPFGMRLSTLMISKRIVDTSVPISLLADHPNVEFHFLRPVIGVCNAA